MKSLNFFLILLFLVACTDIPNSPSDTKRSHYMMTKASFCNVDADCTCGGIDTKTDNCFVGNKLYASKYVDFSRSCPDFCTGIAGHLETKCVNSVCKNVQIVRACTEEAKICPDGSAVGRTGPNCEFAPCPGVECSSDADCVPAECCHATACVPVSKKPSCDGVMCTMECRAGTLDCEGSCYCQDGKCSARLIEEIVVPGEVETMESCAQKGGKWMRGNVGYFCNYPARDAGMSCTDGEQCEGECLVVGRLGKCSDYSVLFGCITVLENGRQLGKCID